MIGARRRKESGIRKATTHAGPWSEKARAAIERIPKGEEFTVEDLRKRIRTKPPHANAWGMVLHNAANAGLIARRHFVLGTRPESHARVIAIWVRL